MSVGVLVSVQPSLATTIRNYVSLTKPRIISLLLVTTIPAMVVAERGWPSAWLILATLVGGTLSAAGANSINCWYDRDIDRRMKRTMRRPVATGAVEPAHALAFGITLGAGAFAWLAATTTLMAAGLATSGLLFYVFVYTIWLKRRSAQNIVVGGAAGAFPPLAGWAAVTGDISLASAMMFLVIFLWTPPHFWALALKLRPDYIDAGVPMLPVTRGPAHTRTQIFVYTLVMVAVTVAVGPLANLSWLYVGAAVALGGVFTWYAWQLLRLGGDARAMALYKYSLLYLALLFAAMGADAIVFA